MATAFEGATLAEVEREHILNTLTRCNGNRTHTARILRISLRGLRNKLRDYAAADCQIPRRISPGRVRARPRSIGSHEQHYDDYERYDYRGQ
jgi:two-component system, response regulator FlrC